MAVALTAFTQPWTADWSVLGGDVVMNGRVLPAALAAGWMVLIATVLAYLTGVVSVQFLSPAVAAVVANLEAVVATVAAWFLLGERLGGWQLVGGVLVLIGAFTAQTRQPAEPAPETAEPPAEPPADRIVTSGRPH